MPEGSPREMEPEMEAWRGARPSTASPRRVRRVKVKKAAPFCNYYKYVAHHVLAAGVSPFVTTVGPYGTRYDVHRSDEIAKKGSSIHPRAFVPGGFWQKYDTFRPASSEGFSRP